MTIRIDHVTAVLRRSLPWRARCAREFPEDARNLLAIEQIEKLNAANVRDVSLATLTAFPDKIERATLREAASAAVRDVGFRRRVDTIDEFFRLVLEKLDDLSTKH
jgi:hypothetical protein